MKKIFLVVTVDTEEEGLWNSAYSREFKPVQNIKGIPRFQQICNKYDIKPTYLTAYSVCRTPWASDILGPIAESGSCEIGGHLHPWNTPPFEEEISKRNSLMCHLPSSLVARKLDTLLHQHEAVLGKRPHSFRAGRWGFNEQTGKVLIEKKFTTDTSICPLIDYTNEGIPLYKKSLPDNYWLNTRDIFSVDHREKKMLEIPATVVFNRSNSNMAFNILDFFKKTYFRYFHIVGILSRLSLLQQISLSPEMCTLKEMKKCADIHVKRNNRILNVFFHSSDLMAGGTPYVRDNNGLDEFLNKLDKFFSYTKTKWNFEGVTLSHLFQQAIQEKI